MSAPPRPAAKAELRRALLARRRQLRPGDLDVAGRVLADALLPVVGAAHAVAAYAAGSTEPPTGPLLAALTGCRVLLPVLCDDGDLDWALWQGELVPGLRDTVHPPGPRLGRDAVADCDVVVVPALAVDRRGVRLGRGGGSYDRALDRYGGGQAVALLHDGELVDALPEEPHDVRVDAAVTPSTGLVRLPGRMSP